MLQCTESAATTTSLSETVEREPLALQSYSGELQMFKLFFSVCCPIMVALLLSASTVLADGQTDRTMNVALAVDGDETRAVVSLADGTSFSELEAIADALTDLGFTQITLFVQARGDEPNPQLVTSGMHVGVRLTDDSAELYLSEALPYKFAKSLAASISALPGINSVNIKSIQSLESSASAGNPELDLPITTPQPKILLSDEATAAR